MTNLLPSACWTRSNKADSKSIFPKEILRLTRASVLAYKSCETRTLLEVDRAGFEPATSFWKFFFKVSSPIRIHLLLLGARVVCVLKTIQEECSRTLLPASSL